MAEKKSLTVAKKEAQNMSLRNPGIVYYVMDKPRKRAIVTGSDWIYRERVLEGWHTYVKFLNGKMV